MPPSPLQRQKPDSEQPGLALLACAVIFNAWYLAPELRINRVPLNDLVFHIAASERMETAFARGEPFMDPWVSEWALGYPVWRTYQPLPHAAAALVLRVFRGFGDPAAIFSVLFYLLLVTFPISVYVGARLLGLPPPAAGLAALLAFAPNAAGDLGRYGLGYGAQVWRGTGLYSQLFALPLMVISIGIGKQALDTGRRSKIILASVLLALTALSHLIFGYAAFVSAALVAVIGARGRRSQRLVRLATIAAPALLLMAWFAVPFLLASGIVNHSRWEPQEKWDSYGARIILGQLLTGRLLDFGRLPMLSILVAAGAAGAVLRRRDPLARRLLALSGLWLALFFGRATWGGLVILAGVPADLPMHRFQGVFELSAILLAAYGVDSLIRRAAQYRRELAFLAGAGIAIAVLAIGAERATYLEQNGTMGEENLTAWEQDGPNLAAALADVDAILAERPGRVSAGPSGTWGGKFLIGSVPVSAFLSLHHLDAPDMLYHAMSKTSDIMYLRDENNMAGDVVFGIRAVVAPSDRSMQPWLRRRSLHGRFAVYESSPEGYFGIVDIAGHYVGPPSTDYEPNSAWMKSALQPRGLVISFDPRAAEGPPIGQGEALPTASPGQMTPPGRVLAETKAGERYQARIEVDRPAYAFIKITWNPDLAATVDGQPAPVIQVTPGFGAVPVPAGRHDVSVEYRPGLLKPVLFVLGVGAFVLVWRLVKQPLLAEAEALGATAGQPHGRCSTRRGSGLPRPKPK